MLALGVTALLSSKLPAAVFATFMIGALGPAAPYVAVLCVAAIAAVALCAVLLPLYHKTTAKEAKRLAAEDQQIYGGSHGAKHHSIIAPRGKPNQQVYNANRDTNAENPSNGPQVQPSDTNTTNAPGSSSQ